MNVEELERLVALVQNANIRELTLRQDDNRITIRKQVQPQTPPMSTALIPIEGGYEGVFHQADYTIEQTGSAFDGEIGEEENISLVTSPLVGVFHHLKPLVGLGAKVRQGQVVGIIEAVKLMNEVMAPCDGKVVDVLIEDGMPVEYGQELYAIEPAA